MLRTSEKLRGSIEQLELMLEELETQIAQTAPAEPEEAAPPASQMRILGAVDYAMT